MSSQTRPNVEIRSASSSLPSQKLHLFPVGINYSGPARVSDFLVLQNASGDIVEFDDIGSSDVAECSFRGRLLKGRRIAPPSDYTGYVLRDEEQDEAGGARRWSAQSTFNDFVYWERDLAPKESDKPPMWMKFCQLAGTVHAPVSADAVAGVAEQFEQVAGALVRERRAKRKRKGAPTLEPSDTAPAKKAKVAADRSADSKSQKPASPARKSPKAQSPKAKSPKAKSPKTPKAKSPKKLPSPAKSTPRKSPRKRKLDEHKGADGGAHDAQFSTPRQSPRLAVAASDSDALRTPQSEPRAKKRRRLVKKSATADSNDDE